MVSQSAIAKYAADNPRTTTLLANGRLKFVYSGMEFSADTPLTALVAYEKGRAYRRAVNRQDAEQMDITEFAPYLMPHKILNERHFLYCTLTKKTVPRLRHKVNEHVSGKRFKKLREEAVRQREEEEDKREKRKADRMRKRQEAGDSKSEKMQIDSGDKKDASKSESVGADGRLSGGKDDDVQQGGEITAIIDGLISDCDGDADMGENIVAHDADHEVQVKDDDGQIDESDSDGSEPKNDSPARNNRKQSVRKGARGLNVSRKAPKKGKGSAKQGKKDMNGKEISGGDKKLAAKRARGQDRGDKSGTKRRRGSNANVPKKVVRERQRRRTSDAREA